MAVTVRTCILASLLLIVIYLAAFSLPTSREECKQAPVVKCEECEKCEAPGQKPTGPVNRGPVPFPVKLPKGLVYTLADEPLTVKLAPFTVGHDQFFLSNDGPEGVFGYLKENPGELAVSKAMASFLPSKCEKGGIFLDIGANSGAYGTYAAKIGCHSIFFDLQPSCHKAIQTALLVNNLAGRGVVIPRGVNHEPATIKISPSSNCHGQFMLSTSDRFTEYSKYYPNAEWKEVETISLDEVLPEDIKIAGIKIDTEGNEFGVLKSMWKLIQKGSIDTLIVEITPQWWAGFGVSRQQFADEISKMWDFGYVHIVVLETQQQIPSKAEWRHLLLESNVIQTNFYISKEPLPRG